MNISKVTTYPHAIAIEYSDGSTFSTALSLPTDKEEEYQRWLSLGNTPVTGYLPENDPQVITKTQERMELENEYLECSRQICLWAGDELEDRVYPKMSNEEFKAKSKLAVESVKEEANRVITTMTWCLFELQLNYNWTWNQIEYRTI